MCWFMYTMYSFFVCVHAIKKESKNFLTHSVSAAVTQ